MKEEYCETVFDGVSEDYEYEDLPNTTGSGFRLMCFPFSITATCCADPSITKASINLSKVILTAEETKQYQTPWEKQQKKITKKTTKNVCLCWCCMCTCLCNPMRNRLRRRVSTNIEKRATCYKQLIEMTRPSTDQIHIWSASFEGLIGDEGGKKLFDLFLQQEHSDENLQFWLAVNKLRKMNKCEEKISKMRKIYMEYLKPMSSKEINISGITRKKIEDDLQKDPQDNVFDAAQTQIYVLMHRQSYPRFLSSDLYHAVVQSAYAFSTISTSKSSKHHKTVKSPKVPKVPTETTETTAS